MSLTKNKAISAGAAGKRSEGGLYETVKVVVQALLLALVVRTFLFQPFNIPSGSMKSTLLVGDYIFVSKFSYGYSRYSFPFGPPLFAGRVWAAEPKRGDVVVFKLPTDNETDYIKRVIGYRETLPNGVSYTTLDLVENGIGDNTQEYVVPPGHYFMMGDNRDNSTDSRFLSRVGYVPFDNLVGRANIIFFSVREGAHAYEVWRWPWTIRWNRL